MLTYLTDTSTDADEPEQRAGLDSVQPVSGWLMYELTDGIDEQDPNEPASVPEITAEQDWFEEYRKAQKGKQAREDRKFELLIEAEKLGHPILRKEDVSATA